jgi:hypothetical protein
MTKTKVIRMRVSEEERDNFMMVAAGNGMSLSDWARRCMDREMCRDLAKDVGLAEELLRLEPGVVFEIDPEELGSKVNFIGMSDWMRRMKAADEKWINDNLDAEIFKDEEKENE